MAWLFSKRCKSALSSGKILVSIPKSVRIRLLHMLNQLDERFWISDPSGYNTESTIVCELLSDLKGELGLQDLYAYPESGSDSPTPADFESFVLRGNYPPYLLDALELFYSMLEEKNQPSFQTALNNIMDESKLGWRMANGRIFPVDSTYVEEEILRNTYSLLHEVKFHGALREFEDARTDFANSDYKGAIQNSNMAVESTIKGILGIEKAKPGELFRAIIDSGLIPDYLSGFLEAFEKHILRCVAVIRNEELGVGHGQGISVNEIPPNLAEMALNLSAVLINFLIKQFLASSKEQKQISDNEVVPF